MGALWSFHSFPPATPLLFVKYPTPPSISPVCIRERKRREVREGVSGRELGGLGSCCGVVEHEARARAAAPGEFVEFSIFLDLDFEWVLELGFDAFLSTLVFLAP